MKLQHKQKSSPKRKPSTLPNKPFPPHLKLHKLALAGVEMQGTVSLLSLTRLASHSVVGVDALADAQPLALQLSFGFDREGWLIINGRITGSLPLVCQRCLEVIQQAVDLPICLARVTSEKEMARLPSTYEPLVHNDESINTIDLIEDDILLSLPMVPMHSDVLCAEGTALAVPHVDHDGALKGGALKANTSEDPASGSVNLPSEWDTESAVADSLAPGDNPFRVLEALKASLSSTTE